MTGLLQRFMNIERDEVAPILMAGLYFFFILTALMILRPAREALGMRSGLDTVRWLFMLTLVATLLLNPVFGLLVSKFRRLVFIAATYLFFAANLVGFYVLLVATPDAVGEVTGRVFYVWMSVFNLFVTMVFWALMADRFTLDQSKRLFGLIAVGGTVGAMFGSAIAWTLAERIGTPMLLVLASAFLALAVAAAWTVTWLTTEVHDPARAASGAARTANQAVIGGSAWEGFRAVFRSQYLMGISAYVLILAVLVTFLYFTRLQMVAAVGETTDAQTGIFAQIDFITQASTLVLQAIVAGHLMKRIGVSFTLALLPITVALGYIGLAVVGTLTALIVFEAVFRAVQRAIMRPARETLFTVVSREDKYKSKAFVDTFVYRGGDAVGAQVEGALVRTGMGLAALAAVAVPLAIVWGVLGVWLGRAQARIAVEQDAARARAPEPVG
jgi:ATP:ADP antiporter, AAA family